MSTSNIKNPLVPRVGFISEWTDTDLQKLQLQKSLIERELEKYDLLLVSCDGETNVANVIYYKWLQLPFVPYHRRLIKKQKLQGVAVKNVYDKGAFSSKRLKKHNLTLKKRSNFIERIKRRYAESQAYQIPVSVHHCITKHIISLNMLDSIFFINIYYLARNQKFQYVNCIDFSFSASQLVPWRNFKYYLDAIVVCDFMRFNLMSSNSLLNTIKLAFIRNSKKGQQRSFLVYIQKLLSLMGNSSIQSKQVLVNNKESLEKGWVIVVSGKFAVTGRTQKFRIQPKKLPLHTLTNVYDYAEGFVNTKAGTFSIRVWRPQL